MTKCITKVQYGSVNKTGDRQNPDARPKNITRVPDPEKNGCQTRGKISLIKQ